ncbi:MAG: VWA domain-containing protein [Chlorobiales bacterium]|nr:VWA domain-containing protein [Chlorobiales bacterium]
MQELFLNTETFELAQPWWLLLLLLLPFVRWLERRYGRGRKGMIFPEAGSLKAEKMGAGRWVNMPQWFSRSAIVLALLATGRPQISREVAAASDDGIDIMLALDISDSMLEEDLGGSRLDAAKKIALRFIQDRSQDRVGLVLFRGKSFTLCPLTLDHRLLGVLVGQVSVGAISDEGTAIGSAILMGTNRLKASFSGEKVLVLLTDGESNRGEVGPVTAAGIAANEGVRIYTVGVNTSARIGDTGSIVGERGGGSESVLGTVAEMTGGRFFRASDKKGLADAFREIDSLERGRLKGEVRIVRTELYPWLLLPSVVLLVAGLVLGSTRLLRIP